MITECTPSQLEFGFHGRRQVTACFDGGRLTTEGSGLLLRETDARIGLRARSKWPRPPTEAVGVEQPDIFKQVCEQLLPDRHQLHIVEVAGEPVEDRGRARCMERGQWPHARAERKWSRGAPGRHSAARRSAPTSERYSALPSVPSTVVCKETDMDIGEAPAG